MGLTEQIDQLLMDMDILRPVAIAAMPDDQDLRARTRRMISQLESIRHSPAVPLATYTWLSSLVAQFLDAEHGALLKPAADGKLPEAAKVAIEHHADARRQLLAQALQDIPTLQMLLEQSCNRIGRKAGRDASLTERARRLDALLQEHLQQDAAFRRELQQLIAAFTPSMNAIASVVRQVGDDAPELRQAREILEQELPADAEAARALLQAARQSIQQAGTKLATASEKLNATIQQQVEKMSALSSQLQQAESEARNDPLTGLPNRRRLAEFLRQMASDAFCFLIIDIDFFKRINDTYGHDVGDEILQQLGRRLQESIRDSDLAARIGGEEFCIVYPGTSIDTGMALADKLRQSIAANSFDTQRGALTVTVSIGAAEHNASRSHSATFKAADQALYLSKRDGRNQVSIEPAAQ